MEFSESEFRDFLNSLPGGQPAPDEFSLEEVTKTCLPLAGALTVIRGMLVQMGWSEAGAERTAADVFLTLAVGRTSGR